MPDASRTVSYGVGIAMTAAVLWPAFRSPPQDSYPLSNYPMFSRKRSQPWVDQVVAVTRAGERLPLEPALVANSEVMQAAVTVKRAIQRGRPAIERLCQEASRRVAASSEHQAVLLLEVSSVRYDPVRYFTEGPKPEERRVHHRCVVRR